MRTLLHSSPLLLILALIACTESTTAPEDTGISFTPPDAAPDTGSGLIDGGSPDAMMSMGDIGQTCGSDTDCAEFCATEGEGFRDGYCSQICDDTIPCPDGSACVQVSRDQAWCLDQCDNLAEERECRAGYGCAVSVMLPAPVCIPGCTDDTDCPDSRVCNPMNGGSCFNPESDWGDACDRSADCPDGAFCFAEGFRGWPSGMCMAFGCDPTDDAGGGCPSGTACVPAGRSGFGRCVTSCETVDECRDGYDCLPNTTYPERLTCTPACETNSQCSEGRICTDEGTCG